MTEAATAFFEALAREGHHPMLESVKATVRFDLTEEGKTERWFLTIDKGDLTVSRRNVRADCVIRAERSLFEGLASGRVNAMAALLRGALRGAVARRREGSHGGGRGRTLRARLGVRRAAAREWPRAKGQTARRVVEAGHRSRGSGRECRWR